MNKYYKLTEETPAYYAAVILNPGYKWQYFEKIWDDTPGWTRVAKNQVRKLWKSESSLHISSTYSTVN